MPVGATIVRTVIAILAVVFAVLLMARLSLGVIAVLLAILAPPLAIGAAVFATAPKEGPALIALGLAAVAFLLFGVVTVVSAERCYASYRVHVRASILLTPTERETLETRQWICPTFYNFSRNGEKTCLGVIADEVGVGCG